MCGRYPLWELRAASEYYDVPPREFKELEKFYQANYNAAPTQQMPVVTNDGKRNHMQLMRWGFMAPWMRDYAQTFKYSTFNARSEDAFAKPMWRSAVAEHRCIVPANGFYEWVATPNGKQPYFIQPKGRDVFGFAGVYSIWEDAEGQPLPTYSIMTTSPNKEMAAIHNRMPVILQPSEEKIWLNPKLTKQTELFKVLHPYHNGGLKITKVSQKVNNARNNSPDLVVALKD